MSKTLKHTLWFLMAINLIVFAPCTVAGISDLFDLIFEGICRIYIWQYKFMMLVAPLVLLRIVYANYLLFIILVILQIIYIRKCKDWNYKYNYKMPKIEKAVYIAVWVILIIGVLYSEFVFRGVMSL